MELTKYQHACFTLQLDGQTLVIDPGEFSGDFTVPTNVAAIVITHDHPDHFSQSRLDELYRAHPDAVVVGPASVISKLSSGRTATVQPGDTLTAGPFTLKFFGGKHALIHSSIPVTTNVGVLVNDTVYYPGDSFAQPDSPVHTLALPVAAPWLKLGEVIDFLMATRPKFAFPTHDAILSDIGRHMVDGRLAEIAKAHGGDYQRLDGKTIPL